MTFQKLVCSFTFLAFTAGTAWSCPADLDESFGEGGMAFSDLASDRVAGVSDSVIAADGSILLAGFVRTAGFWDPKPTIFRVTATGEFDDTFGDGGLAQLDEHAAFHSIALEDDGSIVAAFDVYDGNEPSTSGVARFDEDGSLDETFGDGGSTILDRGRVVITRDVLVRSDDAILVAGQERVEPFGYQAYVYFFSAGGELEDAVELGDGTLDVATSLVEVDDGAVVAGGIYSGHLLRGQMFLSRLTADNETDPSFGEDGTYRYPKPGSQDEAWRIGRDAEGRIYLAGNFAPDVRRSRVFVNRFLDNGDVDESYGRNGRAVIRLGRRAAVRGLAVDEDGTVVVSGWLGRGQAALVARFTPDGERDRTFGKHGVLRLAPEFGTQLPTVNLQEDDRIVAAGGTAMDALVVRLEGGEADGSEACLLSCGDGDVAKWEECDDGNTVAGDGCDAICQNE